MSTIEKSPSEQIDAIVGNLVGWKAETLARLRSVIRASSPVIVEEVKWKKPSKPEGIAVWACNGNICMADILKNAVRLTFPKGARISDPQRLFNTRLNSKTVRAIDFSEGATINEAALRAIIMQAIELNSTGN